MKRRARNNAGHKDLKEQRVEAAEAASLVVDAVDDHLSSSLAGKMEKLSVSEEAAKAAFDGADRPTGSASESTSRAPVAGKAGHVRNEQGALPVEGYSG
jgi:hypothetical protein